MGCGNIKNFAKRAGNHAFRNVTGAAGCTRPALAVVRRRVARAENEAIMRLAPLSLILLVPLTFPPAPASAQGKYMAQATQRVGKLVDDASDTGYKLFSASFGGGILRQGEDNWVALFSQSLESSLEYLVLASGDDDARDVDLEIRDENGKLVAQDIASIDANARIVFRPTATARYTVRIRLYASDRNQPCICVGVLMAKPSAGGSTVAPFANAVAANPARIFEVTEKTPLAIEGSLRMEDSSDPRRTDCRVHVHNVKLSAGKTYIIDQISRDFDSYLRIEDAAGKQLAENDDGGDALNSRIEMKPDADGVYRILTTTCTANTHGRYFLTIRMK
jgi:hypothetical protein